jgi:hypothetical protein
MQQDTDFWQLVVDRWHELRKTVLADSNILADIDQHFQLLNSEAAARNFAKWRNLGQFTVISPPGFRERNTYQKEIDYLKDWLVRHAAWVDAQFVPAPSLSHPGGSFPAGAELQISSPLASRGRAIVSSSAAARVKIPTDNILGTTWTAVDFVPDATWLDGRVGVGFDNSNGYDSITATDVESSMRPRTSALIRLEFDLTNDPQQIEKLSLQIKYDDGFVAYLNGIEVARSSSVTQDTPGQARATAHEAYNFESFEMTAFRNLLRQGKNVLAIHGINALPTSTDFLIIPELIAEFAGTVAQPLPIYFSTNGTDPRLRGGAISPDAQRYTQPIRIDRETQLKARILRDGIWSPLTAAQYLTNVVPANASNLRISEIHFSPADARPEAGELQLDNDEFEFIELLNISRDSINLEGVKLTEVDLNGSIEGIDFTFEAMALPPGGRAVLVENEAAFRSRYGQSIPVAGQYLGKLNDAGERLTLLAADGTQIQAIHYSVAAGWPEAPSGGGPSLQIINALGNYAQSDNWRSSGIDHGTPGEVEYPIGDSNLDRRFDSADIVRVFQAGEYEDALTDNSTWAEGDWNGDREFTTRDLVLAFQLGQYVNLAQFGSIADEDDTLPGILE